MVIPARTAVTALVTLTLSTLSLKAFTVAGYPVTLAVPTSLLFIAFALPLVRMGEAFVLLILVSFVTLNGLLNSSRLDGIEFLRSYALVVISLACLVASYSPFVQAGRVVDAATVIWTTAIVALAFAAMQILELLVLKTTSLWFVLDGLSISTADDVGRFEAVNLLGYYRPTSLYHEPSYFALVMFTLYAASDRLIRSRWLRILLAVGIVSTLSTTVFFFFLLYLAAGYLERRPKIAVGVSALVVATALSSLNTFLQFSRLDELGMVGTSGYIRLVLPVIHTIENLKTFPFGLPVGQSDFIFDNSFLLVISYFGILSPVVIALAIYALHRRLQSRAAALKYLSVFGAILFVNGAVFTTESAMLILCVNLSFFFGRQFEPRRDLRPTQQPALG